MNDSPAFESRRVRTQPRTVTWVPVDTFPFKIEATSTGSIIRRVSLDLRHEDWNDLPWLPEEPRRLRGDARARPAIGPSAHARRRRRRRARRQHVRLHRQGEAGI